MLSPNTTLLRSLKGCPISVVVALLTQSHDRSLGPKSLAALTGYDRGTVSNALTALAEMGLAQQHARYRGWSLTTLTRQLLLPTTLLEKPSHTQDCTTLASDSLPHTAPNLHETEPHCTPPTPAVLPPPSEGEILPLPPSSSSKPDPRSTITTTTTNYSPAEEVNLPLPQLLHLLLDAGIFQPLALRIASDPWCTPRRATSWINNIRTQMAEPDHTIRSLPALLASNLQAHREPPTPTAEPDNWTHFTQDEYADFIDH